MASLNKKPKLSIIVAALNEGGRIPLLLADINRWPKELDLLVVDACSSDYTALVSKLAGAKVIQSQTPNRGLQLNIGAENAIGEWLLFLHADSRLPKNWAEVITSKINQAASKKKCWFFEFKVEGKSISFGLMEKAVAIRSHLFKRPYGDQGLLINKELYKQIGGFSPLYLMEDLDFIKRLTKQAKIQSLNIPLYTNSRRWEKRGVFKQALRNLTLRLRWKSGEPTEKLAKDY